MLRNGFEPGMGLGKDCLGNADVVDIKGNPYKYGLGYEPGMPGRRNVPSRFRADRVWPVLASVSPALEWCPRRRWPQ